MTSCERMDKKEDDAQVGDEIGRMIRENREWAIEALRRVGATVVVNSRDPDDVEVTATQEQLLAAKNEKPPYLYHGSATGGIETFEPRGAPERPMEPPLVYASPSLRVAEMSMLNGVEGGGGIYDGNRYVFIIEPREEYLQRDQAGYVYKFRSDAFQTNSGIGLGDQEWVSPDPVVPDEVITYASKLDKVIEDGTAVYFVTKDDAERITSAQSDPQKLAKILGSLESENELRDKGLV